MKSLYECSTEEIQEFINQAEKRISILSSQSYRCGSGEGFRHLVEMQLQYRADIKRYEAELKNRDINNYYKPTIRRGGFRS